jgi:hypothetical protein
VSHALWIKTASAIGDRLELNWLESSSYFVAYFIISQLLLIPIIYGFTRVECMRRSLGSVSSGEEIAVAPSRLASLEDRLAMLLKGVQARVQSMKHRDGAIGVLSGLS